MSGVRGVHIGDGAYVDFDGIYWWLSTDRGAEGTHRVALDCTAMFCLVGQVVRDLPELAGSLRAVIDRAAS